MTPPAATSAGRRAAATKDSHRRSIRHQAAQAAPRRVSGPSAGRAATVPAPFAPARRPFRRTGPARSAPARSASIPARALAVVRGLPDHSLLDRIVRGRAWIPLLGVMLAGIVAMQVEVLKLGANMGRAIERGTALQSRNELLRASVATLSDDQRIERLAAGMGMVMPAPTAVGFVSMRAANAQRAVANIHQPDAPAFLSTLEALNAAATPPGSTTAVGTSSTTTTTTTSDTTTTAPADSTGTAGTTTPATGTATTSPATTPVSPSSTAAPTPTTTPTVTPTVAPTTPSSSGGAAAPTGG